MSIKNRIVIASTLKPVDDVRSYRKIGDSLGKTNNYDVKIIGYGAKPTNTEGSVDFIPTGFFARLSLRRLFLPLRILGIILKLKPELLIIQTHELLLPGLVFKLLVRNAKLVYDVRENYAGNIRSQNVFPLLLRPVLAGWVRVKERFATPHINCFFVAEKGYLDEMPFLKLNDHLVLENKSILKDDIKTHRNKEFSKLLFTGNLSQNSGVMKAMELYDQIKKERPEVTLRIAGHAPDIQFLERLKDAVSRRTDILLNAGQHPLSYDVIEQEIAIADIGLVTYEVNDSNRNCIPTKVFEYLAAGLPFIAEANTTWTRFASPTGMVFVVSSNRILPKEVVKWYQNVNTQYPKRPYLWAGIEKALLAKIYEILLQ